MKSLLSSSLGRQSPSFTQRMEAKKRQEEEEEARKRRHSSSSPQHQQRLGLSSSYNGPSTLRSFLYSNASSPTTAQTNAPETTPTSDEETMVVIEGFLTKQGQRFKTWKRRWCVVLADPPASRSGTPNVERDHLLEDGERQQPLGRKAKLYYAKQPQSRSSRGEVTLDHFSVLDISTGSLDEEAMALQPSDLMPTSHCFCVNTQKRVYYFCCDTAEDLVRWQRALQSLTPHNQNRSDDDIQQRQPRLEREVRHLFRDLCEVMRDHDVDGNIDENHHYDNGDDDSDPEEADYVAKGKEAMRDGSFSPGSQKKKKKGNRKEEKRREKEREWLRVIEAEVQQAETIEDEDERREEWVRLKQALTKGMERVLLHSDRRRAELTLRAAAAKASSMMADGSTSDESEGEAAEKQKNEEGKGQKNESGGAAKERRSENGAAGRRREGTRRAGGRDEDDQDGWNSDGFDTSREATLAREIMGQRGDDIGYRDEGLYGDDSDGGLDDAQGSGDTEDEEDGLLESDKRRHAKRKRKSRLGRKKAPTRRIYSYGQEENIGFEGEPETEQSFAGGGGTYGTYGAQRKSSDDGHQRDFDPTRTSSSSFWSCFCC